MIFIHDNQWFVIWEYNITDRKYLKAMLDEQASMGLIDEDDL